MTFYKKFMKFLGNKYETEEEENENVEEQIQEQSLPFYKSPMVWIAGIGSLLVVKSLFSGEKRYTIRGAMFLSKNFRVGEFLRSSSIPELKDYELTKNELANLNRLANVLQSIRDDIGAPISITSGGRPPSLKATEGKYKGMGFVEILRAKHYKPSEVSQHMDFSAADFTTSDKRWLPRIMESMLNPYYSSALGKSITQVILYIDNGIPNFIHLGVASNLKNFIKITEGKRLLLAQITGSGKTKKTRFIPFSLEKMNELITQ